MKDGKTESGSRRMSLVYDEVVRLLFGEESNPGHFDKMFRYELPKIISKGRIDLEDAADIASSALENFTRLAKNHQSKQNGAYLRTVIDGYVASYWRNQFSRRVFPEFDVAHAFQSKDDQGNFDYPCEKNVDLEELVHAKRTWAQLLRDWSKDPKLASKDILQLVEALILVAPMVTNVDAAWNEAIGVVVENNNYNAEQKIKFARRIKAQLNRKPWVSKALCRDKRNPPNSCAAAKPTPAPAAGLICRNCGQGGHTLKTHLNCQSKHQ